MTAPAQFVLRSAPWHWQPLLVLFWPFWYFWARSQWPYVGGWALQYGRRRAVGVKPPRLLQAANRSLGERVFAPESDFNVKAAQITCHELVHAFTQHLRLPHWLNEGLAMVTVDHLAGKATVKAETLALLGKTPFTTNPSGPKKLRISKKDEIVALYVRGYWLTRFVVETQPALMRDLLSARRSRRELEDKIAAACGLRREQFWHDVDRMLLAWQRDGHDQAEAGRGPGTL